MRTGFLKIAGPAIALAVVGAVVIIGLRAQPNAIKPGSAGVTTNWVGYLVVGTTETIDPMPGLAQPHPTADRQIEIGLRSDGVVVWREAPNPR